jgi:hemolysin III
MASLTGSFRLSDIHSVEFAPRRRATANHNAVSPTESFVNIARTAMNSVPTIDSAPSLPGMETVAKWAEVLKRPAVPTRTAVEDLQEERINAITHGLGLVLSVAGFAYLLTAAMTSGSWIRLASCGVYGVSLMAMYAASTSLHAARTPERKLQFQVCDHVSIYLLIVGTYTPFMASLEGHIGWVLLGCVWTLAAFGIAIKVRYADRLNETSPMPYVVLGWLALAAIRPLMEVLATEGLVLLIGGGVSYSLGVIFFCRDDKRYFHAIWHVFVMGGTACHFFAILLYVGA